VFDEAGLSRLGIPLARADIHQPPSGETKVTIVESVRDYDVYILNTVWLPLPRFPEVTLTQLLQCAGAVNTSLIELCIMIHACKVHHHHLFQVSQADPVG